MVEIPEVGTRGGREECGLPTAARIRGDIKKVCELLPQTKTLNQCLIRITIGTHQVSQKTIPLAHEHEQTTPRSVIMLMRSQVFRQFDYSSGENGDLNLRRAAVSVMTSKIFNELGLCFTGYSHVVHSILFLVWSRI